MKIAIATMLALLLAGTASALPAEQAKNKEIRVVGCVQWEKDYRQARNEGRGGVPGTGAGVGNEYVLTDAQPEGADTRGKKIAYGITGDREKELGRRIGQQIEVIGTLEEKGEPNSERAGDLPRIKMTAWIPLKDSCPAP